MNKFFNSYFQFKNDINYLNDNSKELSLKGQVFQDILNKKQTHIVVIGESASAEHMSLYNYKFKTNPLLTKMKDDLMVLSMNTKKVHTIESILELMTLSYKNQKTNLISLLNAANYKTYWVSNQSYFEKTITPVTSLAEKANFKFYTNPFNSNVYDESILPIVSRVLKNTSKNKIIFVHLMGSHMPYIKRSPKQFKKMKRLHSKYGTRASNMIFQYDNSIYYNDFILNSLIQKLKKSSQITTLTYFSDHGEEVFDNRAFFGHNQSMFPSNYMTHVPFIIWRNKVAQKILNKVDKINIEKKFNLGDFSTSYLDFLNIKTKFLNRKKSFFNHTLNNL